MSPSAPNTPPSPWPALAAGSAFCAGAVAFDWALRTDVLSPGIPAVAIALVLFRLSRAWSRASMRAEAWWRARGAIALARVSRTALPLSAALLTCVAVMGLIAGGPAGAREALLHRGAPLLQALWDLAAAVALKELSILDHELGHLLAAWALRMEARSLFVGALRIAWVDHVPRLGWAQESRGLFSGETQVFPTDVRSLRARTALMFLAGVGVDTGTLVVTVALYAGAGGLLPASGVLHALCGAAVLVSGAGLIAFFSAKGRDGGTPDRAMLTALLWRTAPWQRLAAHAIAHAWTVHRSLQAAGFRARDFAALRAGSSAPPNPFDVFTLLDALEQGRWTEAEQVLASFTQLEAARPHTRLHVALQATYLHALERKDLVTAEAWLRRVPASKDPDLAALAHAAVQLVRGHPLQARAEVQRWERGVSRTPSPDFVRLGHRWAHARITAALAPSEPPADPSAPPFERLKVAAR